MMVGLGRASPDIIVALLVFLFAQNVVYALNENSYCGTSFADAAQKCQVPCPSGFDFSCSSTLGSAYKCYYATGCYEKTQTDAPTENIAPFPTQTPSRTPTSKPTELLTETQIIAVTLIPTTTPSAAPSEPPSEPPTASPIISTESPSSSPTFLTNEPTVSMAPSAQISSSPSTTPSSAPFVYYSEIQVALIIRNAHNSKLTPAEKEKFKNTLANWFFLNKLYDNMRVILTSIAILSQEQVEWEERSKAGRKLQDVVASAVTISFQIAHNGELSDEAISTSLQTYFDDHDLDLLYSLQSSELPFSSKMDDMSLEIVKIVHGVTSIETVRTQSSESTETVTNPGGGGGVVAGVATGVTILCLLGIGLSYRHITKKKKKGKQKSEKTLDISDIEAGVTKADSKKAWESTRNLDCERSSSDESSSSSSESSHSVDSLNEDNLSTDGSFNPDKNTPHQNNITSNTSETAGDCEKDCSLSSDYSDNGIIVPNRDRRSGNLNEPSGDLPVINIDISNQDEVSGNSAQQQKPDAKTVAQKGSGLSIGDNNASGDSSMSSDYSDDVIIERKINRLLSTVALVDGKREKMTPAKHNLPLTNVLLSDNNLEQSNANEPRLAVAIEDDSDDSSLSSEYSDEGITERKINRFLSTVALVGGKSDKMPEKPNVPVINVVTNEEQPKPKLNEHLKSFHRRQLSRQASQTSLRNVGFSGETNQHMNKSGDESQQPINLDISDKSSSNVKNVDLRNQRRKSDIAASEKSNKLNNHNKRGSSRERRATHSSHLRGSIKSGDLKNQRRKSDSASEKANKLDTANKSSSSHERRAHSSNLRRSVQSGDVKKRRSRTSRTEDKGEKLEDSINYNLHNQKSTKHSSVTTETPRRKALKKPHSSDLRQSGKRSSKHKSKPNLEVD